MPSDAPNDAVIEIPFFGFVKKGVGAWHVVVVIMCLLSLKLMWGALNSHLQNGLFLLVLILPATLCFIVFVFGKLGHKVQISPASRTVTFVYPYPFRRSEVVSLQDFSCIYGQSMREGYGLHLAGGKGAYLLLVRFDYALTKRKENAQDIALLQERIAQALGLKNYGAL